MKNTRRGFTLVELVIVIAIIAILAAVLIPTFSGVIDNANRSAAMQEARNEYTKFLTASTDNLDGGSYIVVARDRYAFFIENGGFRSEGYTLPSAEDEIGSLLVGENETAIRGNIGAAPKAEDGFTVSEALSYPDAAEDIAIYRVTVTP